MMGFHNNLMERHAWYADWHKSPKYDTFHWLAFLAVSVVAVFGLISNINAAYNPSVEETLAQADKSISRGKSDAIAEDHILVKFKDSVGEAKKNEVISKHKLKQKGEIAGIKVKILDISEDDTVEEVVDRIKGQDSSSIEFVELDYTALGTAVPNDPQYGTQWHHPKISSPAAWDIGMGSSGVVVAIIDSGVYPTHEDLASKLVTGYSWVSANTSDTSDVLGHGTATAGAAAAICDNSIGVAGVGCKNGIMPLVVLNSSNFASYSSMASAITYAADHGAKVMNISIGGTSFSSTLDSAAKYAWNKGLVIVASAGNYNNDIPLYPAALNNVLAVGATDENDNKAGWSNYGSWVDVMAPGNNICTTANGGGYRCASGTSFSSPVTAGLAALLFSANPTLSNNQVVSIIKSTADDLGAVGIDPIFASGRINAARALASAGSVPVDNMPPSAPTSLTASAPTSEQVILNWVGSQDNIAVSGYKIYRNGSEIGSTGNIYFTDNTVLPETAYNYTVVAYDSSNNSSSPSNIASVTTPKASVKVLNYQVVSKTANSAVISWTTNVPSTGSVSYGTTSSNLNLQVADGVPGTNHSVTLTGLNRSTKYFYRVSATAADGSSSVTGSVSNFRTPRK